MGVRTQMTLIEPIFADVRDEKTALIFVQFAKALPLRPKW